MEEIERRVRDRVGEQRVVRGENADGDHAGEQLRREEPEQAGG